MKKIYKIIIFLSIIFILYSLLSCLENENEYNNSETGSNQLLICLNPVHTWELEEPDYIVFYTNDKCYLGGSGQSFWAWGNYLDTTTTKLEVNVSKLSGNLAYGAGVIFCLEDRDNFLTLMIGTRENTGSYIFGIVKDKDFIPLSGLNPLDNPWVEVDEINSGYGVETNIKIEYINNNTFQVQFNSLDNTADPILFQLDPVYSNDFTNFPGGKYGYIVTSSPFELFPDYPVNVKFQQIYPTIFDIDIPMFRSIGETDYITNNQIDINTYTEKLE